MSKFSEAMRNNPARLVIRYQKTAAGDERFEWGMMGKMPLITLVGYMIRIQSELAFRSPEPCDEEALAILWDGEKMSYFVHPNIPVDSLVGMLEMVKLALISSHSAQRALAQGTILGPSGNPMR